MAYLMNYKIFYLWPKPQQLKTKSDKQQWQQQNVYSYCTNKYGQHLKPNDAGKCRLLYVNKKKKNKKSF